MDNTRFSMREYKPVSFEERINALENKRFETNEKRAPLIQRKQEIELESSKYNSQIRQADFNSAEYINICKWQTALAQEKRGIEKSLAELKTELNKINLEIDNTRMHLKKKPKSTASEGLGRLRDTYMAFASDTTRVSSMRAMASKFVEEIQMILKEIN